MRSTILSGQSWPEDALESCYPVRSPSYCTCTYSTLSRSTSGHLFLVGQKQVCGDHLPFPVATCDKKIHFSEVLHQIYHFCISSFFVAQLLHRYVYSCRKVSGCVVYHCISIRISLHLPTVICILSTSSHLSICCTSG